jgi:DNA transformation protein and related proteins
MEDESFVAYVLGQLSCVEALGCRAMFGGHALYAGRTFFGIVSGERLYLKTDGATVRGYECRGMRSFCRGDCGLLRTYYEVPADVLADRRRLAEWARAAAQCAAGARQALA